MNVETRSSLAVLDRETICPYCGVGCRVDAIVDEGQVVRVSAPEEARPNFGQLCPKGGLLNKIHGLPGRLTHPKVRDHRDDAFQTVDWDTALRFIADRFDRVRKAHGHRSVAFYGSGQLDTEASYVAVKLFKGALGCNNMDTNSRLCMASAAAGYIAALGSDGPPACYEDMDLADTFLVVGANMADNHPILWNRVMARRRSFPGSCIVCVDPRVTQTARQSDLHLQVALGGDLPLLQALAGRILEVGDYDARFIAHRTSGFVEWADSIRCQNRSDLCRAAGVSPEEVTEAADRLVAARALLSLYCQGVNQSSRGTANNCAIINLHLLLGQIGREGAGPFSLTGQPNAMGGRECGYLSHQLPGYRFVENPAHRGEVEQLWRYPSGSIDSVKGLPAVPMFEAIAREEIRALWVVATNPAASMPDLNRVRQGLGILELCVVQDCFEDTETAEYAHVLLPAAQWGEKIGTGTNSERLVTRSRQLVKPPGKARPDWWILAAAGRAMGLPGFDFDTHEDVWNEYRTLTRGRPCDQWGMTNERLDRSSLQWPCPDEDHPGTARLYTHRRFNTNDRRARFHVNAVDPSNEPATGTYPLALTTGRIATQWHTRTRTAKIPELNRKEPDPFVQIHPEDASERDIADGEWVFVRGARGSARARARVTVEMRRGTLFAPFHWGDTFAPETSINALTSSTTDPISGQPELKLCPVNVEPDRF